MLKDTFRYFAYYVVKYYEKVLNRSKGNICQSINTYKTMVSILTNSPRKKAENLAKISYSFLNHDAILS